MTKLLEQALTTVSTKLSRESQDRLARLLMGNFDRLEEVLEDALDEQVFEASAAEAEVREAEPGQVSSMGLRRPHGESKPT